MADTDILHKHYLSKTLLDKEYSWESTFDLHRDIEEVVDPYSGEFSGTIRVVIIHEPKVAIWRQDDDGNKFKVGAVDTYDEAEDVKWNLEDRNPGQTYWIEEEK